MERWGKLMAPKLAEDAKTRAAEEADLQRRKAAHLQKTEELAMQVGLVWGGWMGGVWVWVGGWGVEAEAEKPG